MKMSIEWHEEGLKNMRDHLDRERAALNHYIDAVIDAVKKTEQAIFILETQIREAKKNGKDGFDPDRFMPQLTNHYRTRTGR